MNRFEQTTTMQENLTLQADKLIPEAKRARIAQINMQVCIN